MIGWWIASVPLWIGAALALWFAIFGALKRMVDDHKSMDATSMVTTMILLWVLLAMSGAFGVAAMKIGAGL